MNLTQAINHRALHRRQAGGDTCVVCDEPYPCRDWRLARAAVLVAIRSAFAAGLRR